MVSYFTIVESANVVRELLDGRRPTVAVVLGSALGGFADRIDDAVRIPYENVPHFRQPSTPGHEGALVAGTVAGRQVLVLSGRLHGYEGYPPDDVTFGVRIVAALDVDSIVLTNSAGGIDASYHPGDVMIIDDHLNLTGENPLRGPNDDRLGPRFPDLTSVYDRAHVSAFEKAALGVGLPVHRGVYAGVAGPSYETPAEIRMLGVLGAHAVGMSTVHEAIVARHAGLRVAGLSLITNAAAGLAAGGLSHDDVIRVGSQSGERVADLLEAFCGTAS